LTPYLTLISPIFWVAVAQLAHLTNVGEEGLAAPGLQMCLSELLRRVDGNTPGLQPLETGTGVLQLVAEVRHGT